MLMAKLKNIQEIPFKNFRWINLRHNGSAEINYLRENFAFHPLDLQDCSAPAQRPKLDEYDHYLFLILIFPYFDPAARQILASEIDFFIGPNYLISLTDGKLLPLNALTEQCQLNDDWRQKYLSGGSMFLLSEIINKIQLSLYPMLDHMSQDVDNVQKIIFHGQEKKMVKDILFIRQNIISFRKIIQAHKNTIKKLILKKDKFFIPSSTPFYLNNNLEQTKDLWDILDGLKENIDALHNTNESLISFKLKDVMKILTTISVTLLPLELIAVIFGMNTPFMPIVYGPYGFWIILSIMALVMTSFIIYFKKKDWL